MGIEFKFSPQKSDYSRTHYYFDIDKKLIKIKYQQGETVIIKKDGIYFEDFRIGSEEEHEISFEKIKLNQTESLTNSGVKFVTFVSVDENDTIKVELLKQYGKDKESDINYLYPDWYYINENKWDHEILDLKTTLSGFEITIKKWSYLLFDIINQIYNLTLHFKDEINRVNNEKNIGSPISIRAIKSSILFLQFNYLETLSNFIANLIIEINTTVDGAPIKVIELSSEELEKVKEDVRFTGIEDKITLFPKYLAKILDVDYILDKSGTGWQNLKMIKIKRDLLSHPKMTNDDKYINLSIDNIRPDIEIKDSDLFLGVEVIYWFNSEIERLFRLIGINNIDLNDYISFKMLFDQLSIYSKFTEKELAKKYKFFNSELMINALKAYKLSQDI